MRRRGTAPGTEVIAVVGARGGVGASTLAALLARSRSRDRAVALVDLDPVRGGIDVLLGLEGAGGARWEDLTDVRGPLDPGDLDDVLPRWGAVEVLGGGRSGAPSPAAVDAVVAALAGRCDTVVADLPAHVVHALAGLPPVLGPSADLVVVTSQDVVGVAAVLALRAVAADPAHLVLRGRAGARVAPLEASHLLDLPLAGVLPSDRSLADAVDCGLGPVLRRRSRLARVVERVADRVGGG